MDSDNNIEKALSKKRKRIQYQKNTVNDINNNKKQIKKRKKKDNKNNKNKISINNLLGDKKIVSDNDIKLCLYNLIDSFNINNTYQEKNNKLYEDLLKIAKNINNIKNIKDIKNKKDNTKKINIKNTPNNNNLVTNNDIIFSLYDLINSININNIYQKKNSKLYEDILKIIKGTRQ
jgi:hypothetical protein